MLKHLLPAVPRFFIAIEFGRFGWGRTPAAILPRQRGFGFVRVSYGPGSVGDGLRDMMATAEQTRAARP